MERYISKMKTGLLDANHKLYEILCSNQAPKWWRSIKKDEELYIEVRKNNIIDIYYHGGRMAEIKLLYKKVIKVTAHPKYLGHDDKSDKQYYKQRKRDGNIFFDPIYQDCEEWIDNKRGELKKNIERYYSGKENGEDTAEKERINDIEKTLATINITPTYI